MTLFFRINLGLLVLLSVFSNFAMAVTKNGFDLDDASIPVNEIFQGGPPRDGIPAISQPKFLSIDKVTYMDDDDRILGIVIDDQAKAYPIKILDWHEIVNDKIGDLAFAVTYCPLCGTGAIFSSTVNNKTLEFGVSGLLYESDVLLYDRNTDSLWSQMLARSVSGELKDVKLKSLPAYHTSWKDWTKRHPNTLTLSTDTGSNRNYKRSPYAGYDKSPGVYFKVSNKAPAIYHPKEQVMGIEVNGKFKAYPFIEMGKNAQSDFTDNFSGEKLTVHWNQQARSAYVTDESDNTLITTIGFWFAWYTFHPDTDVFSASEK